MALSYTMASGAKLETTYIFIFVVAISYEKVLFIHCPVCAKIAYNNKLRQTLGKSVAASLGYI
jgi:hypothetical protein